MKVSEILDKTKDAITVRRVFGDPYEKDGATVIPAAIVAGGSAGGGGGEGDDGGTGEGGGFGMAGRPAGAFVIRDGTVSWQPAIDPNRIVAALALVIVAYLLSRPRMIRAKAKAAVAVAKAAGSG